MSSDPKTIVLEYLEDIKAGRHDAAYEACLLYTSPSPRDS